MRTKQFNYRECTGSDGPRRQTLPRIASKTTSLDFICIIVKQDRPFISSGRLQIARAEVSSVMRKQSDVLPSRRRRFLSIILCFFFTASTADQYDPLPLELSHNFTTRPADRRHKASRHIRNVNLEAPNSAYSTDQRNLQALQTTGEVNILVVLLQFQDHTDREVIPAPTLDKFYNSPQSDPELYPTGSVRTYMEVISYHQLTIKATVIPWYVVNQTEAECAFGASGLDSRFGTECVAPVLDALDQVHMRTDNPFNWQTFDQNLDGFLDSLLVMHSGYAVEYSSRIDGNDTVPIKNQILSHASGPPPQGERWQSSVYSVEMGNYGVTSAFHGDSGVNIARIGPVAKQVLHTLGLPDLYDYSKGLNSFLGGAGAFSVMSSPWGWGNSTTYYPGHLDPWSKIQLGWIEPVRLQYNGNYTLRDAETYPEVYMIDEFYPEGEYLLIENRQSLLYDKESEGEGVIIWHVDDSMMGNSNPGYLGQEGWPENGNHYQVAVLQADGLFDLEQGNNVGDEGDFFVEGRGVGPGFGSIFPNTDAYQNGTIFPTGIVISKFVRNSNGTDMTFGVMGLEDLLDPDLLPSSFPTSNPPDEGVCLVNVNTRLCDDAMRDTDLEDIDEGDADEDCACYNFCPNGQPQGCVRAGEMPTIDCQFGPLIAGCRRLGEDEDDDVFMGNDTVIALDDDGLDGTNEEDVELLGSDGGNKVAGKAGRATLLVALTFHWALQNIL